MLLEHVRIPDCMKMATILKLQVQNTHFLGGLTGCIKFNNYSQKNYIHSLPMKQGLIGNNLNAVVPLCRFSTTTFQGSDPIGSVIKIASPTEKPSTKMIDSTVEKAFEEHAGITELSSVPADLSSAQSVLMNDLTTHFLSVTTEPTLASIGLGGWSPVGVVQQCLNWLHVSCDLPWWLAIVAGTLVVRTLLFPLVVIAQRNSAKLNNNIPELQELQMKLTKARQTGNAFDEAFYKQEIVEFLQEKKISPYKSLIVPLAQTPLFITLFMGLRGMINAPVESMHSGGILCFTDLISSDPGFLLPIITCATFYLTIEMGTDNARLAAEHMIPIKNLLRALPFMMFPFIVSFPAAILTYLAANNSISFLQAVFFKKPAVREVFKIDKLVEHKPSFLQINQLGAVKGIADSWYNVKIISNVDEPQRLDAIKISRDIFAQTSKCEAVIEKLSLAAIKAQNK